MQWFLSFLILYAGDHVHDRESVKHTHIYGKVLGCLSLERLGHAIKTKLHLFDGFVLYMTNSRYSWNGYEFVIIS